MEREFGREIRKWRRWSSLVLTQLSRWFQHRDEWYYLVIWFTYACSLRVLQVWQEPPANGRWWTWHWTEREGDLWTQADFTGDGLYFDRKHRDENIFLRAVSMVLSRVLWINSWTTLLSFGRRVVTFPTSLAWAHKNIKKTGWRIQMAAMPWRAWMLGLACFLNWCITRELGIRYRCWEMMWDLKWSIDGVSVHEKKRQTRIYYCTSSLANLKPS